MSKIIIYEINFIFLFSISICFSQQQITETLNFDGQDREYIVYIPLSYNATTPFPVLFSFHGGAGYAFDFIQANDMRSIADTAILLPYIHKQLLTPKEGQLLGFIRRQLITMTFFY